MLESLFATLLKTLLQHRCFPVKFAKFLWIPCLQNTYGWMLFLIVLTFLMGLYFFFYRHGKWSDLFIALYFLYFCALISEERWCLIAVVDWILKQRVTICFITSISLNERSLLSLNERSLQNVRTDNPNPLSKNEDALTHLLLYGDNTLTDNTNTFLLNSVIEYITSTKRYNDLLIL